MLPDLILAATDPGAGTTFTLTSALTAVAVGMAFAGLMVYALWTTRHGRKGPVERWLDSRLARRAARALDRGDEQILRAVEQHEAASRGRHSTVPKQLTAHDRSHR